MYVTKFTVKGKGVFPVDMLRYDQCCPYMPEDAAGICPYETNAGRNVTLFMYHKEKYGHAPTTKRWESFGWLVTKVENPVKL